MYKAQAQAAQHSRKYSHSNADFDRVSQRLEKGLGLGSDTESLLSMEQGGRRVSPHPQGCPS